MPKPIPSTQRPTLIAFQAALAEASSAVQAVLDVYDNKAIKAGLQRQGVSGEKAAEATEEMRKFHSKMHDLKKRLVADAEPEAVAAYMLSNLSHAYAANTWLTVFKQNVDAAVQAKTPALSLTEILADNSESPHAAVGDTHPMASLRKYMKALTARETPPLFAGTQLQALATIAEQKLALAERAFNADDMAPAGTDFAGKEQVRKAGGGKAWEPGLY